jgi:hypothetical protein
VRETRKISHQHILCVVGFLLFATGLPAQTPDSKGGTAADNQQPSQQAQQTSPDAQETAAPSPASVVDAWSGLLQNVIPGTTVDPTVGVAQHPVEKRAAGGFLDHFFMEDRTEYWRTQTSFTGLPTPTGVINVAPTGTFNPNGIPDPSVFQPNTNEMYSFLNLGTRGWLSDRLNTNFAFRYEQDITHVNVGAPGQALINTFNGNRLFEVMSGYVEINGLSSDGIFAGSSLRLGRQDVYGSELAELDGASFTFNRPRYSLTLFGGRRFTYFSNPGQRAVGGLNLLIRLNDDSSFEYDGLVYITGTHTFTYRRHFRNLILNTHFRMVGGYPVDWVGTGIWTPDAKSTVSLSLKQKITNRDYFYDYTLNARDLDPHNPLLRLYLGPLSPYSQIVVDARRAFTPRIELGGALWLRALTNSVNQGPFDTSFQDYRFDAQLIPARDVRTYFEYHERDSDRLAPFPSAQFDDVSRTGETLVRDLSLEAGRSFGEGRVTVRGGGFYRMIKFQDRFLIINNAHDKGLLGRAQLKLDQRTRLYFDYDLDSDFFVFAPDIQHAQTFRLGLAWRY